MEGSDERARAVSVYVEWGIPVNYGLMIFSDESVKNHI